MFAGQSEDIGYRPRLLVVGAGISGLATAYQLAESGRSSTNVPEILLLEGRSKAGGVISTAKVDDLVLELGPDSFTTQKPLMLSLCKELGLAEHIITPCENLRRLFVAYNGKLCSLPDGFFMLAPTKLMSFLSSPLFTAFGKFRMGLDLLLPPKNKEHEAVDESVAEFVTRRLGKEALEKIAQPMVGGIYTGDPKKLSAQAVIPWFVDLERKYGSIIRGLWCQRMPKDMVEQRSKDTTKQPKISYCESGPRYNMFVSLDQGLQLLVDRLAEKLPRGSLCTDRSVRKILPGSQGRRWDVLLAADSLIAADAVVIATSSKQAADIVCELAPRLSLSLRQISYASSVVVNLVYRRSDIPHPLDGFGFVVPFTEGSSVMACSFSSVKFAGRAPVDKVVLRAFVGGILQREICDFSDEQILQLIQKDLHRYLGIKTIPLMSVMGRHYEVMPQYNIGYECLIKDIDLIMTKLPGLGLAGNAYSGIGIPDCISSGQRAANKILKDIGLKD